MSSASYSRPHDVLWRLAADRVLVRRVGDLTDAGCADLIGLAAAVWVGLDEPATESELAARLAEADIDADLTDTVRDLVEAGWIQHDDG